MSISEEEFFEMCSQANAAKWHPKSVKWSFLSTRRELVNKSEEAIFIFTTLSLFTDSRPASETIDIQLPTTHLEFDSTLVYQKKNFLMKKHWLFFSYSTFDILNFL